MQTFLPYRSYEESARCLDRQRLGKQRVEAKQLLIALGVDMGKHPGNTKSRWRNHPAVAMWRGSEHHLAAYGWFICEEWKRRGYRDTLQPQFAKAMDCREFRPVPAWVGNEQVFASHRSNLLRKYPEHYGQFGWEEPDDLPYVWPSNA